MAPTPAQEAFLTGTAGKYLDPDGVYNFQCVDVAIAYAIACFPGVSWEKTFGRGNANMHYPKNNGYWESIPNIDGDLASVPQRGDIIIWKGNGNNPYGHIAVVLSADAYNVTVLQQNADGSGLLPTQIATLPYDGPGTGPVVGWLRPKGLQATAQAVTATQRVVGSFGVKERPQASTAGTHKRIFEPGDVLNFKGYVHGEPVDGNDLWYVGAFSGTYFHSSGFTAQGTAGLADLTPKAPPAPKLTATQRLAGPAGVMLRATPAKGGKLVDTFDPGAVLNFKGYVHGAPYEGNDVWLVGISGNYVWSGGVSPANHSGLPDLTPKAPAPAPTPAPAPQAPNAGRPVYTFDKAFPLVSEVRPAHVDNFLPGNMPATVSGLVIHQFIAGPTRFDVHLDSVIQSFTHNDRTASAHFGVEGKRVVQFVALTDRAYHAGPGGNDHWSIEVYGGMDAETLATVALLVAELEKHAGRKLDLYRHRELMATQCGEDVDLDSLRAAVEALAPAPAAPSAPTVPTTPAEVAALRDELLAFATWQATQAVDSYLKGR